MFDLFLFQTPWYTHTAMLTIKARNLTHDSSPVLHRINFDTESYEMWKEHHSSSLLIPDRVFL